MTGVQTCALPIYNPLAVYFLRRLRRLVGLRRQQARQLNEKGFVLLNYAIYSSYCDAVDLGYDQLARQILRPAESQSEKVA